MKQQIISVASVLLITLTLQVICRHIPELQNLAETATFPRRCRNYYDQSGVCVSRTLCRSLPGIDIAKRRYTYWDFLIMDGHYCGGRGDFDLVCCDKGNVIQSIMDRIDKQEPKNTSLLPVPGEGQCGFVVSDRITRYGTSTSIAEYPWMALLQYSFLNKSVSTQVQSLCSGVLINDQYVLTAAHCLLNLEKFGIALTNIRLGDWNTSTSEDCFVQGVTRECSDPAQDLGIEKVIIHPNFLSTQHADKDIALVRLAKPANLSIFVKPICLPLFGEDSRNGFSNQGKRFSIAGWKDGAYQIKQTADVNGVSEKTCNAAYGTSSAESTSICTLGKPGTDFVDNGGALMATHNDGHGNNYFYAAGILSYINNRPDLSSKFPNLPKDFSRVSGFVDWIQETIEA